MKLPVLSITLPKVVKIENTRLALFYYILLIAVTVCALMLVFYEKKYLVRNSPTTFASLYVTLPTPGTMTSNIAADLSGFCQDSFTYMYSESFKYENMQCVDLPVALAFEKQSGSTFFFPTYYSDEYIEQQRNVTACPSFISSVPQCNTGSTVSGCYDNPGNGRPCAIRRKKQYWTVGTLQAKVALVHSFEVDGGQGDGKQRGSSSKKNATSDSNLIRTYFLQRDSDEKISELDCGIPSNGSCHFEPAETIELTIEKILQASGIPDINGNNTKVGKGADTKDPPYRLTGTQVSLNAEYKNSWFHLPEITKVESDLYGETWQGVHCYVYATANKEWTSRIENTYINPSFTPDASTITRVRQRYQQGIQVVFTGAQTSEFGFFNAAAIMGIVAVILIYIGIVPTIIKLVAVYLLGNTSRTYMRAQQELVTVQESCTRGLPAKMLSSAAAFYMLSTIDQMGKDGHAIADRGFNGYITKDTIGYLLRHCMKEEEGLDEDELEKIIDAIYTSLGGEDLKVSVNEFIRATSTNEVFDVQSMIATYDVQRKRNIFERLFADATDRATAKERKRRAELGEKMTINPDDTVDETPQV